MSKEVKRFIASLEGGFVEVVEARDYDALLAERDRLSNDLADARMLFVRDTDELIAERDAAQKDAERYRWLRSVGQQQLNAAMHNGGQELDRFVDAALQGAQP